MIAYAYPYQSFARCGHSIRSLRAVSDLSHLAIVIQSFAMTEEGGGKAILKAQAVGYCQSTTIHGFAYLVSGRDLCEKLFWAAVIITGFVLASLIIDQGFG